MQDPQEVKQPRSIRIGPDHVTITDQGVVIEAKHEMPDWQVRQFKVIPIYFEDKKYFLLERQKAQPPYAFRYLLRTWESHIDSATFFQTYDEHAVAERDSTRRTEQRDQLLRLSLMPLYPVLGLLWSGAQKKLVRFGFVPQSLTGVSIFACFCLTVLQGAFVAVMLNVSARAGTLMLGGMILAFVGQDHFQIGPISVSVGLLDSLLLMGLLADMPVRYSRYLREEGWAGGFLEWIVPRSWRKKKS
jgi:hypothetical protein